MKKIDNNISINNIKSVIYLHVLIIYIYEYILIYFYFKIFKNISNIFNNVSNSLIFFDNNSISLFIVFL